MQHEKTTLEKFNAVESLGKDFNPRKGFEKKRGLNNLKVGQTYEIFGDKDPKKVKLADKEYETCRTGDGVQCLAPILARFLIADQETNFYANKEFDEKFHCIIPAFESEALGKEIRTLGDFITKDGHFPKFEVVSKGIQAISKNAMLEMTLDRKLDAHIKYHGEHPHKTEKAWLPQCDLVSPDRGMRFNVGKVTHLYQYVVRLV
jgi:hypothetical protein